MSDYFDQLTDAMARAMYGWQGQPPDRWDADEMGRAYWCKAAAAALRVGLALTLTDPCPECKGAEEVPNDGPRLPEGRYGAYKPCPTCGGDGRVPSTTRLIVGEQVCISNGTPYLNLDGDPVEPQHGVFRALPEGA